MSASNKIIGNTDFYFILLTRGDQVKHSHLIALKKKKKGVVKYTCPHHRGVVQVKKKYFLNK